MSDGKITTFKQVIDAWPSVAEFAEDIGANANTAKLMRFRDSISADYWVDVVKGAKARRIKGITLELLASIQAEKKIIARPPKAA